MGQGVRAGEEGQEEDRQKGGQKDGQKDAEEDRQKDRKEAGTKKKRQLARMVMFEFYSTNKWYVDGQLPNHNEIAQAVAARFPHLRLAIGPTTLNSSYKGADKAQIESVVQSMGGWRAPGAGLNALASNVEAPAGNSSAPDVPASVNQGDMVLVIMPGIGEVVARFVRMQGTDAVVDLDGIEEVVAFSALAPVPPADTKAPSVPPEPPALPVEAKVPSVPPAPPVEEVSVANESPPVEQP